MSNYYYNEKKGRYEPIKNAPFGVAPRPKRDPKVFTAETYKSERGKHFSDHYKHGHGKHAKPSTSSFGGFDMDDLMKKFESYVDTGSTTSKTSTSSSRPRTTTTRTNPASKGQSKGRGAFVWVWIIGLVIWGLIRACD